MTNTGTKSLPLCTWKVSPTKSGEIMERRAARQVYQAARSQGHVTGLLEQER